MLSVVEYLFFVHENSFWQRFVSHPSEAFGAVEAAADAAEEGASREPAHGGATPRGNQQGVLGDLLRDADWLQVRLAHMMLPGKLGAWKMRSCKRAPVCVFSNRLARESDILEERAERRMEIFKGLMDKMARAGPSLEAQVTTFHSLGHTSYILFEEILRMLKMISDVIWWLKQEWKNNYVDYLHIMCYLMIKIGSLVWDVWGNSAKRLFSFW